MATEKKAIAKVEPIQEKVLARINEMQGKQQLQLPVDYIPENALSSAYLVLQETKDRNQKPALQVTTQASQANALLNMVIQGLTPAKNQVYFVVYGNTLQMQRSYFGSMSVAKRVNPDVVDFQAQLIFEDDEIDIEITNGAERVVNHKRKFGNMDNSKIIGAYCTIIFADPAKNYDVVMTFDEIKKSWQQSQVKPIDDKGNIKPTSTHGKFPGEMAKRTVINRAAKHIINSSNDRSILASQAIENDVATARLSADEEVAEYANQGEIIDADFIELDDDEAVELSAPEPEGPEEEPEEESPGF